MEIFYNELSNKPLAHNSLDAKSRIIALLEIMKSLREFDINVLRTHKNFFDEQVSEDYKFVDFLIDNTVNETLKTLLRTVFVHPYIEEEDILENKTFNLNEFLTTDHDNKIVNPAGLSSAHIYNSPVMSIGAAECWQKEKLKLNIRNTQDPERQIIEHEILNIFSINFNITESFREWWDKLNPPLPLNCKENIYKTFSADQYEFDSKAIDDIISWFHDDKRYLIRIKELIEDIKNHPFKGGKGLTEVLKGGCQQASKRIVSKDRIVYTYSENKIIIHQCRGHYEDK